tara:strand:+ start:85 stop:969 length:885 start_codon:yes stop_codon:yes gene_type:complete
MSRARELAKLATSAVFSVDSNNNVGVNSTTPDAKLDVVGVVSATQFFGDGSELSGITAGATLSAGSGDQRVVITSLTSGTMTAAATDAELSYNSGTNTLSATTFSGALTGNATGLSGTPDISVGTITASGNVSVAGTLTYEDVKNIDSVGVVTARTGIRVGAGQSIGSTTASENIVYYGDGSQLSGISAGISTGAASGGLVTLNLTNQDHKVTATGITTITVTGGTEGDSHSVRVVNSGVSTVGFSTYFLFPSGSTPILPTASGAISLISFTVHRAGSTGIATQLLSGAALNFS